MGKKKCIRSGKGDGFWEEGYIAETLSSEEMESRMRTFSLGHDQEMDVDCRECGKRTSAHNKGWHV